MQATFRLIATGWGPDWVADHGFGPRPVSECLAALGPPPRAGLARPSEPVVAFGVILLRQNVGGAGSGLAVATAREVCHARIDSQARRHSRAAGYAAAHPGYPRQLRGALGPRSRPPRRRLRPAALPLVLDPGPQSGARSWPAMPSCGRSR